MKIDFDLLEKMVEAGASGAVVLAFLRAQYDQKSPRRARDKVRKRAERVRTSADKRRMVADSSANSVRDEATLADTSRARLFREAKPALLTLGIKDGRAGGLIVQWLKLTNDDDQLVLATILKAQSLAVAEAPSWILATLKGKTNGNGHHNAARRSASADFFAGMSSVAADIVGHGQPSGDDASDVPLGRVNIDG